MKWLCAIAGALLASCASDGRGGGARDKVVDVTPAGSATGTPMTGTYAAAVAAFRAHAASLLRIDVAQVQGGPVHESLAAMVTSRVGSVWGFTMHGSTPIPEVRGWATKDGVVVTVDQHLGVLLTEAGVWGGGVKPALTATEIAERVTWALGMNYTVFMNPAVGAAAPTLALEDGAGTLSFVVNYQQPGPGGSGGGPRQLTSIEIALGKDHQATLARAPFVTRAP
jgi:hypothetical protein